MVLNLLRGEEPCSRHLCLFFCLREKIRLPHVERRLHVLALDLLLESSGLQLHLGSQLIELQLLLKHYDSDVVRSRGDRCA